LLAQFKARFRAGRKNGAQGIALAELGHKALHRHRLIPEVEIGHQLVAARIRVEPEADVGAIGLEHRQLGLKGLAPVAAHLQ
jgi:hypothetical protein